MERSYLQVKMEDVVTCIAALTYKARDEAGDLNVEDSKEWKLAEALQARHIEKLAAKAAPVRGTQPLVSDSLGNWPASPVGG